MATAIGLNSKVGLKKQTTRGSPVTLGAGDQIIVSAFTPIPSDTVTPNDDLIDGNGMPAGVRVERGDKTCTITMPAYYWTTLDILSAMLGTATNGTEVNSAGAYKRSFYKDAAEVCSAIYTACFDYVADLEQYSDLQIVKAVVTIPDSGPAEVELTGYTETDVDYDSTTNPNSTSWTVPWAELADSVSRTTGSLVPSRLRMPHLLNRVWLAPQGQASFDATDALCLRDVTITFDYKIDTACQDTCGGKAGKPTGHWEISISGTLSEIDDDTFMSYKNDRVPLKFKLHALGDKGAEGVSISGASPSTDLSGGTDTKMNVNLDGDGAQEIDLGSPASLTDGDAIAAAIQSAVRALTASDPENQPAYDNFTASYTGGLYVLQAGSNKGAGSSVVVTDASSNNCADDLKLGTANGGTENAGVYDAWKLFLPEVYVVEYQPALDGQGVLRPTLTLRAANFEGDAPYGFTTSEDSDLHADMDSTSIEIVTINRESTNNSRWL